MTSTQNGRPLRTILLGLGNIGLLYDLENPSFQKSSHFLTHAKSLSASLRFDLLAAVDLKQQNRELFSKAYGLPAFSRLDEMPETFPVDFLVVALPTEIQVKECLRLTGDYVPRHLLIEKPVGISVQEAKQLLDWAELNNVSIFVNYFRNKFESAILASNRLSELNFGKVDKFKISSYGSVRNIFSHFLELSEFLLPGKVICLCLKKEIRHLSSTSLSAHCAVCLRTYEFEGIKSKKKETIVEISGKFHRIRILNNGRDIHLESAIHESFESFSAGAENFSRYQQVVYEKIFEEINSNQASLDLNRAILVQEFIDSIE